MIGASSPPGSHSHCALGIVLVMAGLGMGALNEILEFVVSISVPQSGVGGFINTSLDLCADLIGAVLGLLYIRLRYLKNNGIEPSHQCNAPTKKTGDH